NQAAVQGPSAPERSAAKNGEGEWAPLVATGERDQQRSRLVAGGIQAGCTPCDRGIAETLGGAQQATKSDCLPVRDVHAEFLRQPRGPAAGRSPEETARAGQRRAPGADWPREVAAPAAQQA